MTGLWENLKSEVVANYNIFSVREDINRSPRTGTAHPFYVIQSSDWINIIPLTSDEKVIFVRQFRHGSRQMTLEVPGGIVESLDGNPLHTARREMNEETGYDSDNIVHLGSIRPNPAILNNLGHVYVAFDVRKISDQVLDSTEDAQVIIKDLDSVYKMIALGEITHALTITTFCLFEQYRKFKSTL